MITMSEWVGLVILVGFGVLLSEYIRWTWKEGGK